MACFLQDIGENHVSEKVMHELSIAQNIIEIVEERIPAHKRSRITAIVLRLGEFSGVVAETLVFSFGVIAPQKGMSGASLEIENVPLTGECGTCGKTSLLTYGVFECPVCRSRDVVIRTGQELQVVSISMIDAGDESGGIAAVNSPEQIQETL